LEAIMLNLITVGGDEVVPKIVGGDEVVPKIVGGDEAAPVLPG
jgi:hypothetical protein